MSTETTREHPSAFRGRGVHGRLAAAHLLDMTTTQSAPAPVQESVLDATNRCDGCGAQAYVKVDFHGSELLFCAHDASAHVPAMVAKGGRVVVDETHRLRPEKDAPRP